MGASVEMDAVEEVCAQTGRGGQNMIYSRMNNDNCTEIVAGTDGQSFNDVTCFGCGFLSHYRNQCPYVQRGGIVSIHIGYLFTQGNTLFDIPDS